MSAYYNEIDPYAAEWLRNLIKAGKIPDGEVDTRSIALVDPSDIKRFTQCHFFAGIAGWSHALRLAGWDDDRPVWTGSCPCQPFSVAGKGKGTEDERHLWPVFFNLIRECRPPVVMGEQVAGKAGYGWLDGVRADLEAEDYACRGVDIPACAVDAPHIRQRLYWVAVADANGSQPDSGQFGLQSRRGGYSGHEAEQQRATFRDMADAARSVGQDGMGGHEPPREHVRDGSGPSCGDGSGFGSARGYEVLCGDAGEARFCPGDMADADQGKWRRGPEHEGRLGDWPHSGRGQDHGEPAGRGENDIGSFWSDAIWLTGADGKARRAQPGICLLVDGLPARASKLRAYGNAIVPPLAAEVIKAFMETQE